MSVLIKDGIQELKEFMDGGYQICIKCGSAMKHEIKDGDCKEYICPNCGYRVDDDVLDDRHK